MTGELFASTPVHATGLTEVHDAIELLTLSAATDQIIVAPVPGRNDTYLICTVARMA